MKYSFIIIIPGLIALLLVQPSCKKDEAPSLTTTKITNITLNSVTSGGTITGKGSGTVSESGICWSTDTKPTIDDNKTTDGRGEGTFTSNLTGLMENTIYYLRAYKSIVQKY